MNLQQSRDMIPALTDCHSQNRRELEQNIENKVATEATWHSVSKKGEATWDSPTKTDTSKDLKLEYIKAMFIHGAPGSSQLDTATQSFLS